MKKITILLVLTILCTLTGFSQKMTTDAMLFGHVKNKETQEHIPYATIFVKGTKLGTAADGTGHFKLAHLPAGKQIIIAQYVGYKPQEMEVTMIPGKFR